MAKLYTMQYTCQFCGQRSSKSSMDKKDVALRQCKVCKKVICHRCNNFDLCPDHYNRIPLYERQQMEEMNKKNKKITKVSEIFTVIFILILIVELILNANAQHDAAWDNTAPTTDFWLVRPGSLARVIIYGIFIVGGFIWNEILTRKRNNTVQTWIMSHVNNNFSTASSGLNSTHYYAPSGYQAPSSGYQTPSSGYQTPSSGYQTPSSGYQTTPSGYPTPPDYSTSYGYDDLPKTQKPADDETDEQDNGW